MVDVKVEAPFSCPSFSLNGGTGTVKLIASAADIFSSDPNVFTYTWSPNVGLSAYNTREVYLTDNVNRTYTVTMGSPYDPSFACTRTIVVNHPAWSLPVFTAQDITTCPGTSVSIGQATVAGYSYAWSGNTSFLNSTNVSNPTATVNFTNDFPVLVTDIGSGCTKRDTATVTILGLPANVAGDDITFCGSSTVQLGKSAVPNVTYLWTPATSYTPNNTAANPTVTVATTTTFTVVATNTITGCSVTDNVVVTVNPAVAPFSFTNQTFCPSTTGAIALPAGPGGMTSYAWSPASLVVNSTSNGPTATTQPTRPQSATNYTLTVTNASGCTGQATVTFTPSVSIPVTGGNKAICMGTALQLGGALEAGAIYVWVSNPPTGNSFFSSTSISNPTFTPTAAGAYDLTVTKTDVGGCITIATATITVNTFALPTLTSPTVCQNTCVAIGPLNPIVGAQYFWSPATGLSNANTNNPTACVTNSSVTYTLTGIASNGCADTKTVIVGVNPTPSPIVSIPTVTTCHSAATTSLNPIITPSGSYNYQWSPNNGSLSNIYTANPTVNITGVGTQSYSLTVTDNATGCAGSAAGVVNVNYCPPLPSSGSVGNYVWNDTDADGVQDVGEPGINGVTVELWNASTNTLVSATTTANNGINDGAYNFVITTGGNYYIKFPATYGVKSLTTPTTTGATDGNSDANTSTGISPMFTIDINGTGTAKDNPTIDAGYTCPGGCVPMTVLRTK